VSGNLRVNKLLRIGPDNPAGGGGDAAYLEYVSKDNPYSDKTVLRITTMNDVIGGDDKSDDINLNPSGGVGIKTDNPAYDLDVNGSCYTRGFIQAVRTITIQDVYLPETPLANIYLMGYNSGMYVNLAYASDAYIGSIYYIRKIPPLLTTNNIFFIPASGCVLYDNLTAYTTSTAFTNTYYTLFYKGNGVWLFFSRA
jgi:hypothetical protein